MTEKELRDLDAEVHRKVMGARAEWIAKVPYEGGPDPDAPLGFSCNFSGAVFTADREWLVDDWFDPDANREVPHYSTDIAAAWLVIDVMDAKFDSLSFVSENTDILTGRREWHVVFGGQFEAVEATAPLAICRAALRAVESKP